MCIINVGHVGNFGRNICEDVNGLVDQEKSSHLEIDVSRIPPAQNSYLATGRSHWESSSRMHLESTCRNQNCISLSVNIDYCNYTTLIELYTATSCSVQSQGQ